MHALTRATLTRVRNTRKRTIRYHCFKTNSGTQKLVLRVLCNGDGLGVIERRLELKFWPWNGILLCRVTLEEHHFGREGSSFWVKVGTTQEIYEPCG